MISNKKQWFLLLLAPVWLVVVLVVVAGAYILTRDAYSFGLAGLASPLFAVLGPLYTYHFPPVEANCEVQKLKIQLKDCREKRP